MSQSTAERKLKAALTILDETEALTVDIEGLAAADVAAKQSSLKAEFALTREIWQVEGEIDKAIKLAREAQIAEPTITVTIGEVPIGPDDVIAAAYSQRGLLSVGQGFWNSARDWMEKSLAVGGEHPGRRLLQAFVIASQGYRKEAIAAYQRVIDKFPESDEAIEATRSLEDLRRIQPRKKQTALLLSIFLGWAGGDRFYLGDYGAGFKKLITGGGLGIWWLLDIIRIAAGRLRAANGMRLEK